MMFRKLVKALIPRELFRKIEPFGHLLEAMLWQVVLGFPAKGMKVIGVTGTDGKTTTSTMIYTMLNDAGVKTGLMTTIGYGVPENWHDNEVHMTTMPTLPMLRRIRELRAEGIEWLVLETTSHALAQNRVWGIPYSVGVMTNLGHEHLEYHGTFERYREAKVRLFEHVAANKAGLQTGIVNADDASAPYFVEAVPKVVQYGLENGDLRAVKVKSTADGSTYEVDYEGVHLRMQVNLPGGFNVANSLAAAGVGLTVGLSADQIEHGVAALGSVAGRMNGIDEGQEYGVIVDFAHTPQSFEKLLPQLKKLTKGRLIVMFGSAGERDITKRAIQGGLAGKFADVVVITEEDDRHEDGGLILKQIAAGVESAGKVQGKDLFLVPNRVKAIEFAVGKAKSGDMVVFLGKGHEKTIERADGEHLWNEGETVRAAVRARLGQVS